MSKQIKIVGLGGTLGNESSSMRALGVALDSAKQQGAITQAFDVKTLALPMYDPDEKIIPSHALAFVKSVEDCDAMIWCSPMYHGTVSGVFKNAIDWLQLLWDKPKPYLTNKPIGLIATSGGTHALNVISTMDFIVRSLRGWSVPLVAPITNIGQAFDASGNFKDQKIQALLEKVGNETLMAARKFKD